MLKKNEIEICTHCPLEVCIGEDSMGCPLKKARRIHHAAETLRDYHRQKQDLELQRGYFPQIHGALNAKGKRDEQGIKFGNTE